MVRKREDNIPVSRASKNANKGWTLGQVVRYMH
jgi:hypothetical protein